MFPGIRDPGSVNSQSERPSEAWGPVNSQSEHPSEAWGPVNSQPEHPGSAGGSPIPPSEIMIKDPLYGVTFSIVGNVQAYWWPCMYGAAVNGSLRYWMIGTDAQRTYTISGSYKIGANGQIIPGKLPTPKSKDVTPKRGLDHWTQAVEDITSKINERQRVDQFFAVAPNGSRIRFTCKMDALDVTFPHPKPMLAMDYNPEKTVLNGWWLVSLKLDGLRCQAMIFGGRLYLISRGEKIFVYLEHIEAAARSWLALLPEGSVLDGELYKHGWSMNKVQSVATRSTERHPESHLLEYHVFDLILPNAHPTGGPERFFQRFQRLMTVALQLGLTADNTMNENGLILHSSGASGIGHPIQLLGYRTFDAPEDLADFHSSAMVHNYEGLILRDALAPYDEKRCDSLYKYKEFEEEEVYVSGVKPGEGNEADLALFTIIDKFGVQYDTIRPRGTFELRRLWLQRPELVVGRSDYTVIHFKRSKEHGKMRFPRGKCFRNSGYW